MLQLSPTQNMSGLAVHCSEVHVEPEQRAESLSPEPRTERF